MLEKRKSIEKYSHKCYNIQVMPRNISPGPDLEIGAVSFPEFVTPQFGDPSRPADANKRFAEQARSMRASELALSAAEYACFAATEAPTALFTRRPDFEKGRDRSRQGVIFGDLDVQSELHTPIMTFTAVKPYDNRKHRRLGVSAEVAVAHDWATNLYLDQLSKGSTYLPIGLWRARDTYPVPRLLTRFNERSTSLDNTFRASSEHGDVISPRKAMHALRLGHFALGMGHGARIIHGDAFPQNLAQDGSRVVYNDTTTFRPFGTKAGRTKALLEEDLADFNRGTLLPDTSSPEMRELVVPLLKSGLFVEHMYHSYVHGARLGAERAGYDTHGLIVPETEHKRIVDRVVQKYEAPSSIT